MFTWWQQYKAQRAIDKYEAEIEKAALLRMAIDRAQREYERRQIKIKENLYESPSLHRP